MTVYAKQLILDGSLNMAFYVALDESDLNNSTEETTFSINGVAVEAGDWTFNKDECLTGNITDGRFEEADNGNTKLYPFLVELTSVQMNDPITGTIKVGDKTGTVDSYTVWSYLDKLTTNTDNVYSANTVALAKALKDYGHYALTTLNETNATCKNAGHKDITAANATLTDNATSAVAGYGIDKNGLTGLTFTLDLMSKTSLVVQLPTGASITTGQNITRTGKWLESKEWDESEPATELTQEEYTYDSTKDTITFADISAHELFYKYTIPVTLGESSYTVVVSPMSYVKGALELAEKVSKLDNNATDETFTSDMKNALFTDEERDSSTVVTVANAKTRATNLQNAVIALYNYYTETCKYKKLTPITDTTSSAETGSGQ